MHPRATEEGDTPHPPPRVPSPLRKPVVTGGTHPQLLHLCVCLCAGCAIPSAPKRAREGQHRSLSGTQEGQARPASACARVRQACARGASVAGEGAGSGDGTPTRVMGEEA